MSDQRKKLSLNRMTIRNLSVLEGVQGGSIVLAPKTRGGDDKGSDLISICICSVPLATCV